MDQMASESDFESQPEIQPNLGLGLQCCFWPKRIISGPFPWYCSEGSWIANLA